MADGVMKIVECTQANCTIYSGGSRLALYGACLWVAITIILSVGGRLSPWLSKRIAHGWALFLPNILVVLLLLFLYGQTDTVTLSKDKGTLQIVTSQMMVFRSTKNIELSDVLNASNVGRYSQLRINLRNGDYVNVGVDSAEGGRANAVDAINQWLSEYRGESPQTP